MKPMPEVRVAVVEDNAAFRQGIEQLIRHTEGFVLAGSFASAEALLGAADRACGTLWDLVIMDLGLPGAGGAAATGALKQLMPAVRVLVLTVFEEPSRILDAIAAGADGYAVKSTPVPQILAQLRTILDGGAHLTGPVAKTVLDYVRASNRAGGSSAAEAVRVRLTEREQAVLRQLDSRNGDSKSEYFNKLSYAASNLTISSMARSAL